MEQAMEAERQSKEENQSTKTENRTAEYNPYLQSVGSFVDHTVDDNTRTSNDGE